MTDPGTEPEIDSQRRARTLARTCVPGGALIDLPYCAAYVERLAAAQEALAQSAPATVFIPYARAAATW